MTGEEFVQTFGGIYEHSSWVARRAFEKSPALELENIVNALAAEVAAASKDEQLALLRAHPDLAGKLALSGGLTESSKGEQQSAGLDQCTPEEFESFQTLNAAYKDKFGFPFILAVKGWFRTDILKEFARRAGNKNEVEFAEALAQVHRIARLRLEDYFENNT